MQDPVGDPGFQGERQFTEADRRKAEALLRGGLGAAQLEMAASFCAPLFWVEQPAAGRLSVRNGTATFVDAGRGVFAVTAAHVVSGWREAKGCDHPVGPLRLAGSGRTVALNWEDRSIDEDRGVDLATFRVSAEEVRSLGKSVLAGCQSSWPPPPPKLGGGILYCGYPGVGTRILPPGEVVFGAVPASGVATAVGDDDVMTMLEREHLLGILGGGVPPDNFDFGGMSGGPMLATSEGPIVTVSLAGIIHQGPNTSTDIRQAVAGFELIRARRAHFLASDGRLCRTPLGWRP